MALTGSLFSYKRLTLHSAADGIDVEAVQRAWLQMGDLRVCIGGNRQPQGPYVSAIGPNGGESDSVTWHLIGWTGPDDGDLRIRNLVELQVCGGLDHLCGEESARLTNKGHSQTLESP